MIWLYNIVWNLLLMAGLPLVLTALACSAKRRATFRKRMGLVGLTTRAKTRHGTSPKRPRIWIHALSVGEVLSCVPLTQSLRQRHNPAALYFSVSTLTGYQMAAQQLAVSVDRLFYSPYDHFLCVNHLLARIEPELVIIVETDLWPNLLHALQRREVPVVLVNARLSDRSFRRYRRLMRVWPSLWTPLASVCTQSEQDAARFRQLGIADLKIRRTGNLKFDQSYQQLAPQIRSLIHCLHRAQKGRKTIVAGSTHPGEEKMLLKAVARLALSYDSFFTIIAPRDPQRAGAIAQLYRSGGFRSSTLSALESGSNPQVVVVDSLGGLRYIYQLADVAYVGGSLVPKGGHNPLEPAAWGKPVLFGPDMSNFAFIAEALTRSGGADTIQSADQLGAMLDRLFRQSTAAQTMGRAALAVFQSHQGALERTLAVIEAFMPPSV